MAEALLLAHPDVMAASLIHEEGADGRLHPIAYVVPHGGRMNAAKAKLRSADKDRRVTQWKRAFDQIYRSVPDDHAPTFVGWKSSYTNSDLPESEMREWLDCTAERIISLKPEKVLEIGCGVGLLVRELAPRCAVYRGIDLSSTALSRLQAYAAAKPELRHVELREGEATDLDGQEADSVDTVVINSVAQYFPDINYLRTVLEKAARVVCSGGRIFVGDIRHLGLLSAFHSAVQLAKAPPKATIGWLKRRILLAVEQERELVIAPQFFLDLPGLIPGISGVDVLVKRGRAHNELTRYRYDVVLHVGEARPASVPPANSWKIGDQSAAAIVAQFHARHLNVVSIADVPNSRLASDMACVRRLWSADDRHLVGNIRSVALDESKSGIDPEDFWQASASGACDAHISWPPHSLEGAFDVLLVANNRLGESRVSERVPSAAPHSGTRLATDPLEAAYMQRLALKLQQELRDQVPSPELPSAVLVVRELPST